MKRILKLLFFGTLFLVSLTSAGLWYFSGTLLAHYKPRLEQLISERIGYFVAFESGSIKFYPYIGISLQNGSARSTTDCTPWKVAEVNLKIELAPLLERRFDVERLEIAGFVGTFAIESGVPSMSNSRGESCGPATPPPAARAPTKASGSPISIDFEELLVTQTSLRVFSAGKEHQVIIENAEGVFQDDALGAVLPRFDLKGSFDKVHAEIELHELRSLSANTKFSLKSGKAIIGGQRLLVSGEYDQTASTGRAHLKLSDLSLGEIRRIAGSAFPDMKGNFDGELDATLLGDLVTFTGDATLTDIQTSVGGKMAFRLLEASQLSGSLKGSSLQSIKTTVRLDRFTALNDGDSYSLEHVEGPLTFSTSPNVTFGGDFKVKDFGFSDGETTIKRVAAELKRISGHIHPNGDVIVSVDLDASGMYLMNPGIEVSSVQRVTAPIEVKIPAKGGYSVSGPVAISNGVLTISGRKLENTSGTIAMLVSSPLMDFKSSNISAESLGERMEASTHFSMTKEEYRAKDTVFRLEGGTLGAEFSMHRKNPRLLSAKAEVRELPILPAYRAAMQKEKSPVHGTVRTLTMDVSGNKDDLLNSVTGSGAVTIDGAIFHTVDIEDLAKKAIASIPLVGTELVPSDSPGNLSGGSIASSFKIGEAKVTAPDLKVQMSNMTIEGNVAVGFDSSLAGEASIVFLEQTFRLLGLGFKNLGDFLSREGRIAIPLILGRTISDPSVRPDLEEIAKTFTGINLLESVAEGIEEIGEEVVDDL